MMPIWPRRFVPVGCRSSRWRPYARSCWPMPKPDYGWRIRASWPPTRPSRPTLSTVDSTESLRPLSRPDDAQVAAWRPVTHAHADAFGDGVEQWLADLGIQLPVQ